MKLAIKVAIPMILSLALMLVVIGWFVEQHLYIINAEEAVWYLFGVQSWHVTALFTLSLFVLVLALGVTMRWFVARPLKALSLAVNKISEGNLDDEIRYDAADEVGELAVSFEKMRLVLRTSIEETRRSRDNALKAEAKAKEQMKEVEHLNELMVDRELRMVELKRRVQEHERQMENKESKT